MLHELKLRLLEVVKAVAPLIVTVSVLQFALVHAPVGLYLRFLAGSLLAIAGMMLIFTGIELGILRMGRYIGAELPKRGSLWLILGVAFALGFATTMAEPDVLVLAGQVEAASQDALLGRGLVYIIALGVGIFVALGMLRVIWGFSMASLLFLVYGFMIALTFLGPPNLVPLAYDAGSVTTGVLTAPVVIAVALGLSSVLAERSAVSDGFGLLGLASVGPVIALLILGMLMR